MGSTETGRKGRKPKPEGMAKTGNIRLRCRPAYKAWVEGMAEAEATTVSVLICEALARHAKARKHPAPPEV